MYNIALQRFEKFQNTESREDLREATRMLNELVDFLPNKDLSRPRVLTLLGYCYGLEFEMTNQMADIDRAIQLTREALELAMEIHVDLEELASPNSGLETWLSTRFKRLGSAAEDDLHEAVAAAEMAVTLTAQDHPKWIARIGNLGLRLHERFEFNGNGEDLDEAIRCSRLAAETVTPAPPSSAEQAISFNNLGLQLRDRFKLLGNYEDLNSAVKAIQSAVELARPEAPNRRATYLSSFGIVLQEQYEQTGLITHLHHAIDVATESVDLSIKGHPDRIDRIGNLGIWLHKRAQAVGAMADVEQSIACLQEAVNDIPEDDPSRARLLLELGSSLETRYERADCICDLDAAIRNTREAVRSASCANDPTERPGSLSNLAGLLATRSEVPEGQGCKHVPRCTDTEGVSSNDSLNEAIETMRVSLSGTAGSHTDRPSRLCNLGRFLASQFRQGGSNDIAVMDEAIQTIQDALHITPRESLQRPGILTNLGKILLERYRMTALDNVSDETEAFNCFHEAWNCQHATPSLRVRSAGAAADIHAAHSRWEDAYQLMEQAMKLLPSISPRRLSNTDKQDMLSEFTGMASGSAAVALNAKKTPYAALKLLELGRGVISSLALDMREDLSHLEAKYPSLAEKFVCIRDELDSQWRDKTTSTETIAMRESRARKRREMEAGFDQLLRTIQEKPEFNDFCGVPSESGFQSAASSGPIVVINVSSQRCDAILIQTNGISLLELPHLNMKDVHEQVRLLWSRLSISSFNMASLLEWLWTSTMCPCLDALGFKDSISEGNWPHVWWIPTGMLSQLPLHAAGLYKRPSSETVLDRVMSSYAISVKTLMHGRRHRIQASLSPASDQALLVAMQSTPGLLYDGTLAWAKRELEMLENICASLALRSTTPRACKNEVLKCLQACKIFHFAGHGQSDLWEPSQSKLLLEDWETNALTVDDLRAQRLQQRQPFLAYLSACSTGANNVAKLCDEGIHLASSLQLTGFRHVVGTLWEVSDQYCVDVARVFYESLRDRGMTDEAVCRGLHRAVKELRDRQIPAGSEARKAFCIDQDAPRSGRKDYHWVPYMHFGV